MINKEETKEEKNETNKDGALIMVTELTLILLMGVYFAFILSKIGVLFTEPLGLPSISIKAAYGLYLVFAMLKGYKLKDKKDDNVTWEKMINRCIGDLVVYTVILIVGGLLTGFSGFTGV